MSDIHQLDLDLGLRILGLRLKKSVSLLSSSLAARLLGKNSILAITAFFVEKSGVKVSECC